MGVLTTDKNKLMKSWMKLYTNLMILQSDNPPTIAILSEMNDKLVMFHQYMMDFFDAIGAKVEVD